MKNQSKNQSKNWCYFWRFFNYFLQDFGGHVGPKLDQKSIKKIDLKINRFFDHLYDRILMDFRRIFGPTWRQVGLVSFSVDVFWGILVPLGAKMTSRLPQESPKDQFWTSFDGFVIDFWLIFNGFLIDFYLICYWLVGLLVCWLIDLLACWLVAGFMLSCPRHGGGDALAHWIYTRYKKTHKKMEN